MWKHALIIVLLLIIIYQLWSLSKHCDMPMMEMGNNMSKYMYKQMDPAKSLGSCGNGSFQAYGGENMIAASTISGLSRGFNAAPAGVGGYYDAITTLNDAEHANLASINPELYSR